MGEYSRGHRWLCNYIIERGPYETLPLRDTGETPLHAACSKANRWKYTPVVRLLLARGANPNIPTIPQRETGGFMRDSRTKGETPLHRAAAFGNEEDIQCLLDNGAKRDALDA